MSTNECINNVKHMTAKQLQSLELPPLNVILDGTLYQGLTILASRPKIR